MRFVTAKVAAAGLCLSMFAAAGDALAASAQAATNDVLVTIRQFHFQPMAVDVPVGTTVTWKNLDEEPHTVTSTDGSFRSQALDEGETYSVRFTKPGTFSYLCNIHPQMRATVTVK